MEKVSDYSSCYKRKTYLFCFAFLELGIETRALKQVLTEKKCKAQHS